MKDEQKNSANKRLIEFLVPSMKKKPMFKNPFEMLFGQTVQSQAMTDTDEEEELNIAIKTKNVRKSLAQASWKIEHVTVEVTEQNHFYV